MSASDSDNEVSVGASFSDDFSAADWSRWSCPTGPSCQWTEGDEYCEAQSGLSWGARFANASAGEGGLELSLVYDDACGCSASGSSYTAGHLTSVDYFLHGNLSFVGRFFNQKVRARARESRARARARVPTPRARSPPRASSSSSSLVPLSRPLRSAGTQVKLMDCVSMYSDIDVHQEMSLCFFNTNATTVHISWYTGDWIHSLYYELPFDTSEDFHEYQMRWANDTMAWSADGETLYTRGVAGCGEGPALTNSTSQLYGYYEGDGAWAYESFWATGIDDDGAAMLNRSALLQHSGGLECAFVHDDTAVLERPLQIKLISRPTGVDADDDGIEAVRANMEIQSMTYADTDSASSYDETYTFWEGFRTSCWRVEHESTIYGCNEGLTTILDMIYTFSPTLLYYMTAVVVGTVCAKLTTLAQSVALGLARPRGSAARAGEGAPEYASWTTVGVQGALLGFESKVYHWYAYVLFMLAVLAAAWEVGPARASGTA